MRHCPFLFKAKHDNMMIDSRIMPKFVILYYILSYISFYFFHQSTDGWVEVPVRRHTYFESRSVDTLYFFFSNFDDSMAGRVTYPTFTNQIGSNKNLAGASCPEYRLTYRHCPDTSRFTASLCKLWPTQFCIVLSMSTYALILWMLSTTLQQTWQACFHWFRQVLEAFAHLDFISKGTKHPK